MAENSSPLVVPGGSQTPDGLGVVEEPTAAPGETAAVTPEPATAVVPEQGTAPAAEQAAVPAAAPAPGDSGPLGLIISTH